jgi:NAD(P)-dependent dehydrogenase (short-subunit alcohol dehydrogenase family)
LTGVYDIPVAALSAKGVFTNTTPVDAYRGAGRPEAIYTIERAMDHAARALGTDPLALREANFIRHFPHTSATGEYIDVGDFSRVLARARAEADIEGFPARRAESAARGKLRGLGLCCYIEAILGDASEGARVEFAGDGTVLPTAFAEGIDFEATTIEKMNQVGNRLSEIVRKYEKDSGLPKVLIIGHGVMSAKMSKTLKSDASEWRRVMSTNLDSVFTIVNVIGQEMANVRDGRIVIYSACLGRMSGPGNTGGLAPYRISKSGVNALVRNLAHETGLGSRGLLVDAICPNHSRTDMGGADAPRSAEEGAQTAIWLATRAFTPGTDQTGLLWEDNQSVPW